jgi:hypothetical protein
MKKVRWNSFQIDALISKYIEKSGYNIIIFFQEFDTRNSNEFDDYSVGILSNCFIPSFV